MQSSAAGERSDATLTVPAGALVCAVVRAFALLFGAFAQTVLTEAFQTDPITISPRILTPLALSAPAIATEQSSHADS